MPPDPLSEILTLIKLESTVVGGFSGAGDWAVGFDAYPGIKCYAITRGSCWLIRRDDPVPVALREGDAFLMTDGRPFSLHSHPDIPASHYGRVIAQRGPGLLTAINDGDDTQVLGGHFSLRSVNGRTLLDILPPVVPLHDAADRAAMAWALDRMRRELRAPQPGGTMILEHLADMLLIQALRLTLSDRRYRQSGWLYALADRRIGAAIAAIHGAPATAWTVAMLADIACMSRSGFAARFCEMVGQAPMAYLAQWRMQLALSRLAHEPVGQIARDLGYRSESAFSAAFKRVTGRRPSDRAAG